MIDLLRHFLYPLIMRMKAIQESIVSSALIGLGGFTCGIDMGNRRQAMKVKRHKVWRGYSKLKASPGSPATRRIT
jgi:hypothetical protein